LLLLAYGACNAALYAGLLPLWDGFDEPFHYSYVEQLSRRGELPVQGRATLSQEIWESLALAPGSYLVKRNIGQVIAFDEYFSRTAAERAELRRRLNSIDPREGAVRSDMPNYEAHQPPLAYAVLAVFDRLWSSATLLVRVLRLRLLCGVLSAIAMGLLTLRIAARLGLPEHWAEVAAFLILSSQMFYASTAHVANDWLAIPLAAALILAALTRRTLTFGILLAAGLLTKAYFLAALPFAAYEIYRARRPVALVPLLAAIPWYARNLRLYHDLSGMQETAGHGIPVGAILHALSHFPWPRSLGATVTHALWSGNNSDTTFNALTIDVMVVLLAAAAVLWLRHRRPVDTTLLVAAASFAAGLLYSTLLSYTVTAGVQISPSPWYVQPLFAPTLCLCVAGMARSGRAGAALRIATVSLWTYVICATWLAKLVPLYGGYSGRTSVANLWRWYTTESPDIAQIALMPAAALWTLIAISVVAAVALNLPQAWTRRPPPRGPESIPFVANEPRQ
jgi:hypothetical protein